MKVHIAYDDGTLIGVYAKRKDAKRALDDAAGLAAIVGLYSKWSACSDGIDRTVTIDRDGREQTWEQWIDTYEVQP
jgi:gamma-glutamyl:cysteine ligase YbdK (ATP-grasp superfamily)